MNTEQLSVILLDTKQNNPNFYIVLAIEQALLRHSRVGRVKRVSYETVVRVAQEQPFDILLAVDGEAANTAILSRIRGLVGTAVLWCWEDPYETAITAVIAPLFDLVFTNDRASRGAYLPPALHLPLAAAECRSIPSSDAQYLYDVAFVGSAWPNRVTFLRRLLQARPNLRYRICLGYNEHLPNTYLDLPESSYVGAVSHFDFLHIANSSRVNLALHRRFSGDGLSKRAETPGPRIFETALAGGFQLVDGEGMTLADLYQDEKELCVFNGFEDGLAKLDTLLTRPKRRMAMAGAAQKRTAAEHSYDHRISKIITTVLAGRAETLPAPSPVPARPRRPRLLFVTHNRIASGNFGGVEVYQETISDQLRADYEVFFYQPAGAGGKVGARDYVLTDSRHRMLRPVTVPDFDSVTVLWHAPSEDAFAGLLAEFKIELVHFHHLINHSPSLPLVCRALGIPTLYTFQDFWTVCSRFNLIDHKRQYCQPHKRSRTACDVCLGSAEGRPDGSQAVRRSFFSYMLCSIDRIVFNSPESAKICRQIFPELPSGSFAELGLPLPWTTMHRAAATVSQADTREGRPPLRVVFLGNFTYGKGAEVFLELVQFMRGANIAFTVAGRPDPAYTERLAHCADVVTVLGEFSPGALDLKKFDLSLHLSVWPETYCITLSEAWKADVVPIVSDCGALGDRVHDGVDGFKVPIGGTGEIVALLRRLEGNRRELGAVRANIGPALWLTPDQHCRTLSAMYCELLGRYPASELLVEPGAVMHPALATSRSFPPHWPQLDWPVVPGLPSPRVVSRNPLQRKLAPLRTTLAEHAFDSLDLVVCIDSFGELPAPEAGVTVVSPWLPARPPIQIVGWLEFSGPLDELCLVARSGNGDVILRPVYLHERPDIIPVEGDRGRLGFITDPFALELLQDGIYELSFATWRCGHPALQPLNTAVSRHEHLTALIQTCRHSPIREPFLGVAWPKLAPTRDCPFHYNLDEVSVRVMVQDSHVPLPILAVHGWTLATPPDQLTAQLELELRGPATFHCEMTMVERPDVLQAFLLDGPLRCGFQCAVWLRSLPRGLYDLFLVRSANSGRFAKAFGQLIVGVDPEDTCVHTPPAESLRILVAMEAGPE